MKFYIWIYWLMIGAAMLESAVRAPDLWTAVIYAAVVFILGVILFGLIVFLTVLVKGKNE